MPEMLSYSSVLDGLEPLWGRLKGGEKWAWHEAGKVLFPFAKRAASNHVPALSEDFAEIAAANAVYELIKTIRKIDSPEELLKWLFIRAGQRAIDELRRSQRVYALVEYRDGRKLEGCYYETPDEVAQEHELHEAARDALAQLSEEDAELLLDFLREVPHKEIAKQHGWRTNSVGNRINQALRRAKEALPADLAKKIEDEILR